MFRPQKSAILSVSVVLLTTVILNIPATTANADEFPSRYQSIWKTTSGLDDNCKASEWQDKSDIESDTVAHVTNHRIDFHESFCRLISAKTHNPKTPYSADPLGSTTMTLICSIEGQPEFSTREVWAVKSINNQDVLIRTNLNDASVFTSVRCR